MTKLESEVIAAAVAWWHSRRPCAFTLSEHVKCPAVNTYTPRENHMARKAAALVVQRRASKNGGKAQ